ncbi:MAG: GTPase [bacterium]
MPANLPPQYYDEERKLKAARSPEEKAAILELLLSMIPKHKGTEKLQADLKSRLSKARAQQQQRRAGGGAAKKADEHHVEKEGAGQVALAGLPNAGKSQLLAAITNAVPLVAEYPYSTLKPLPGMARFENVWVQFVDLPPLMWEPTDRWVANVLRQADALCLVVDLTDDPLGQVEILLEEIEGMKVRPLARQEDRVEVPAGVVAKRPFLAGNKLDVPGAEEALAQLSRTYGDSYPVVGVSAKQGRGLEVLVAQGFHCLGKIRVYTKAPSKSPDREHPFVVPAGTTVIEMAAEIHKDFVARFRAARLYCADKYNGQRVGKDFVLRDGDVIEFLV